MASAKEATRSLQSASLFPARKEEVLAADRVLTVDELRRNNGFAFDPDGARNLDLPAEAQCEGVFAFIANTADAAEVITIRNDAAATICTPTTLESAFVWCDGVAWYGMVGDFA